MEFIRWRDRVLKQVRFKPDRKAIREELNGHYEDKVADLERLGYDRKLAESRALETMGDAVEIGKAFDKVHKPWLGWLWKVTTWLAVLAIVAVVINAWIFQGWAQIKEQMDFSELATDYEGTDGPFHVSPDKREEYERIYWTPLSERVERRGYTIELTYAGVWKKATEEGVYYHLNLCMTAQNPYFWEPGPELEKLVMDDSSGWNYRPAQHFLLEKRARYWLVTEEKLGRTVYEIDLELRQGPVEWVEITYPHGDLWTFRLDLRGVDWQ